MKNVGKIYGRMLVDILTPVSIGAFQSKIAFGVTDDELRISFVK
jgi:hypothetical protein